MTVWRRGRLIDHVHLRAKDLEAARRFYHAVVEALDLEIIEDTDDHFYVDELWIDAAGDDPVSHVHLAFQAKDQEMVKRFHEAGLAAGGRDNGGPGERDYHPGYYGAFLLDPDGNNIEAVFHGPAKRNVEAVELTI